VLYETLIHGLGNSPLLLAGYAMGLLAVFFTGFYTFRMVFLTFHGDARSDVARDPEPVRWNVKGPLAVLGIGAATVGLINMAPVQKLTPITDIDFLHQWLDGSLESLNAHHYVEVLESDFAAGYAASDLSPLLPGLVSLGLAVVGVVAAYQLYGGASPEQHTKKLGSIRTLLMNNYYQDEYQVWLAKGVTVPVAKAADKFDQGIIDGVVNGISSVSLFSGERFRRIQTGIVTNYAALLTIGLTLLLLVFGIAGGWF
jgi:NADH-quinone oxidoreductase subunit L